MSTTVVGQGDEEGSLRGDGVVDKGFEMESWLSGFIWEDFFGEAQLPHCLHS